MKAVIVNWNEELKKAEHGKKTKLPVEFVLETVLSRSLRDYPRLQRKIGQSFVITRN